MCRLTTICIIDVNLCVLMGPPGQGWFSIVITTLQKEGASFLIQSIISRKHPKMDCPVSLWTPAASQVRKGTWESFEQYWFSRVLSERVPEDLRRELSMHHFLTYSCVENSASSSFLIAYIQQKHIHTHARMHTWPGTHIKTVTLRIRSQTWGLMLKNNGCLIYL